ncbi:glycoside hydrolase family 5 protein [Triangularia verruculosa]|uniref:Glycoside hydrolase family 5 protein n=1 Tax=Triangularia verruculosa TaxID=2587418 RepID=A0AAN6XH86_9PEZI|nr:glycoside hydrolase family 5 protein [Triangularia verruculosa]
MALLHLWIIAITAVVVVANTNPNFLLPRQQNSSTTWPYGPFSTRGRDIINSRNEVITWAGVNWPLSGETMIPEGLEHASADSILDRIASAGFNFIRMPYAIEMIDLFYLNNQTSPPFPQTLLSTLGPDNGTLITTQILTHNPIWTRNTTLLKIWSDVVRMAAAKQLYVHPDAHVSKAKWCCSHADGNAWFGDTHFHTGNWKRGLEYVAAWAGNHSNIVSMSLRNEPRSSSIAGGYNWVNFLGNMTSAADAIHAANPDLLITWAGMQFGQDLSALTTANKNLWTAGCYKCDAVRDGLRREPVYFNLDDHPWGGKVVWEVHLYESSEDMDTGNCRMIEAGLYRNGFNALGMGRPAACNSTLRAAGVEEEWCAPAQKLTPVILSEFGRRQDGGLMSDVLLGCLREFTKRYGVSWAMWSLAGRYRIREGRQQDEDAWGLLNGTWNGWRFEEGVEGFWKPWVRDMGLPSPEGTGSRHRG